MKGTASGKRARSAWEEKAAFTSFKLVAVEERAVHFDGLSKAGQVREEEFRLRRSTR